MVAHRGYSAPYAQAPNLAKRIPPCRFQIPHLGRASARPGLQSSLPLSLRPSAHVGVEIDRFPTSCIDQQRARRYDALAVHVDDVISLALAGFFVYAGIRILRSPEHHASIRFQPWTYRRVKHKPTRARRAKRASRGRANVRTCCRRGRPLRAPRETRLNCQPTSGGDTAAPDRDPLSGFGERVQSCGRVNRS